MTGFQHCGTYLINDHNIREIGDPGVVINAYDFGLKPTLDGRMVNSIKSHLDSADSITFKYFLATTSGWNDRR